MSTLLEQFVHNASAAGFTVLRDGQAPPSGEDVGVSVASWGIAATGSVVLVASPREPRANSLLPRAHVSLLDADRIVPDLATLFARLGPELPSAVAIVSGPSASGDIEQRHMTGVHAPGEVYVVLQNERHEERG